MLQRLTQIYYIFATMKQTIIILMLLAGVIRPALAQRYDIETQKKIWKQMVADTVQTASEDNLSVKRNVLPGSDYAPFGLHEGLNVSLGASAFATFGKYAPHKGGFTQNINVSYLAPLTKDGKLWLNIGGYLNNMNYGGDSYRDAGIYGILDYQIDEHWETYVYGQLSLSNNYNNYWNRYNYWDSPYGYRWGGGYYSPAYYMDSPTMGYGMGAAGANVLGAGVNYHFNDKFTLGVRVEGVWYNTPNTFEYSHKYDYPVPNP